MRRFESGFSLMEAIVALVILSAGLMATYSWFDQGIKALIKVDNLALEESVIKESIERLELQDFANQDEGVFVWKDYRVDWHAEQVEPGRMGRTGIGTSGIYDLFFFRVDLDLFQGERLFAEREVFLVRHKVVRAPQ